MSVKYIKIRFNTENDADMNAYNTVKGVDDGQNAFIKKAILYYAENGKDEALAERIADIVCMKLKDNLPAVIPTPIQAESTAGNDDFSESADIADAFLDSL